MSLSVNQAGSPFLNRFVRQFEARTMISGAVAISFVIILSEAFFQHGIISHAVYSSAQLAKMDADRAMLSKVTFFRVACPTASMTADEHQHWVAFAASKGWTPYKQGGPGCVDP
jgi:hypothetical protein